MSPGSYVDTNPSYERWIHVWALQTSTHVLSFSVIFRQLFICLTVIRCYATSTPFEVIVLCRAVCCCLFADNSWRLLSVLSKWHRTYESYELMSVVPFIGTIWRCSTGKFTVWLWWTDTLDIIRISWGTMIKKAGLLRAGLVDSEPPFPCLPNQLQHGLKGLKSSHILKLNGMRI